MSDPGNFESESMDLDRLLEEKERLESLIQKKYTRFVTVMFTDLKGSTAIAEKEGDISSRMLIRDHNNIVFPLIEKFEGVLVKSMGDGTLSYFSNALNAVRAAAGIQKGFEEYNVRKNHNEPIMLRIGMHTGNVIIEKDDIFGDIVNTASRFESTANPGEIYISEATFNALEDKDEIQCRFVKETKLKGKGDTFNIFKAYWKPEEIERDEDEGTVVIGAPVVQPLQPSQSQPKPQPQPDGSSLQQKAQAFKDENELLQLLLLCEEGSSDRELAEIRDSIVSRLRTTGSQDIRFMGDEAKWFFKKSFSLGRLQDVDFPLTNKAFSRVPVTIGLQNGEGFLMVKARESDKINSIEIGRGGTRIPVAVNQTYSLGTAGVIYFSLCFPFKYKIFKDRFLVIRPGAQEDCIKAQLNLSLQDIWRGYPDEGKKLLIIGS